MRCAEWIHVVYFLSLSLISLRRMPALRRRRILLLAGIGLAATLGGRFSGLLLGEEASRLPRDWLPAPTLLIAYWQAGQFFTEPSVGLQAWLGSLDDRLSTALGGWTAWVERPAVAAYLEAVYLFAYPLVPLGLAVLWWAGLAAETDRFWCLVLLPTYCCYAELPFAPTLPPRLVRPPAGTTPGSRFLLRPLNLWVLRHFGIGANTFPSGHVAATTAVSLLVLEADALLGVLFVWLAGSIAVSAVALRYHYFADIVLGVLLAVGFWAVLS